MGLVSKILRQPEVNSCVARHTSGRTVIVSARANSIGSSDITYLRTGEDWLHLCAVRVEGSNGD